MFEIPEALPIHSLSKLHYLIHELYLTNHLSFPELLNCGTHCQPLLSLNPTICHPLNLTSRNLILSHFLHKLPLIISVFPLSGRCYRPYGLSPALLTKKNELTDCESCVYKLQKLPKKGYDLPTRGKSYQQSFFRGRNALTPPSRRPWALFM